MLADPSSVPTLECVAVGGEVLPSNLMLQVCGGECVLHEWWRACVCPCLFGLFVFVLVYMSMCVSLCVRPQVFTQMYV